MRELYFDVWAGDDMLGTSLGELTDAGDKRITVVDNGMGSGEFTISRHSAQYDWVTPGPTTPEPLIRCRRIPGGPFDAVNDEYFFAFFVEEGNDVLTSPDEEGGEDATRSGRSIESILSRAVVNEVATYSDDIVNHPYDKTALRDGQWHMDEDIPGSFSNAGTPGAVLRIFLRNAGSQTPEPIPEVTHDFNINNDSNGDPWPDGDAKWSFDVGTSLLDVLGILVNGGLFYRMTPDFVLSAYGTQQGADRTADIVFTHGAMDGTGIASSGERTIHASPAKSRLLVKGQTEDGTRKFRWVADTGIEAVLGVRQGSLDYQASPTNAILDKAGAKKLNDLKNQHDGPPSMGVDEVTGQEAFVDYIVGHTVTVDIPGVYDTEPARIYSISLQETETGEVDVIVEFNGEPWSGVDAPLTATAEAHDEFWYDAGEDNGGPPEVMRMLDYGTSYYHKAGSSHWDDDNDAYIALDADPGAETSSVDIFAFNQSAANYSEIILENGEFFMLASRIWDAEMDGTDPASSKFYFFGGYGIVLESASTDDDPTDGEAGQIIYRNSSNSFRWFNGSIWQDFGGGGVVGGGGEGGFYETVVGDGAATVFDVTHGLATSAVEVELWDLSGTLPLQVMADIEVVDADTIRVTTDPTVVDTDELRVVVVGVTVPVAGGGVGGGGGGGGGGAGGVTGGVGMYETLYGPGVTMDSRSNSRVGDGQKVSVRLIESSDLLVSTVAFNWRSGTASGYSAGTGGVIRISKQTDSSGSPSGSTIGTPITYTPAISGANAEVLTRLVVPGDWASVSGRVVHYVLENIDAAPLTNWLSVNNTAVLEGPDRWPAFTSDFALLVNSGSWSVFGDLPVIDVTYSDGVHDGNRYIGVTVTSDLSTIGEVDGTAETRQVITPTEDVTVDGMYFRVKRISGSGSLTITLDGPGLTSVVAAAGIPTSTYSSSWTTGDLEGGRLVGGAITPTTLLAGNTYYLRLSTTGGTHYVTIPIRIVSSTETGGATWGSRAFVEGIAEKSDDGSTWDPAYGAAPHTWQCYFTVVP